MTIDPLVAIGLGAAVVGSILAVLAGTNLLARRSLPNRAAPTHKVSRRAFLGLAGVASILAVVVFADRARRSLSARPSSPSPAPRSVTIAPTRPVLDGIWVSRQELAALPVDDAAFERLRAISAEPIPRHDVSDQDSPGPIAAMAAALVGTRLQDPELQGGVRDALVTLIGTENGSTNGHPERNRRLGMGRNLPGYVFAASIIDLETFDPDANARFVTWIDELRAVVPRGGDRSLRDAEPLDHSNWGAYGSAAMTAINRYLNDRASVAASADMLLGWLGDPAGRHNWVYDTDRHDYSWQCHYPDVTRYVPVNPAGCERDGLVIDGVIPVDMQRGAGLQIPPELTRYPRESLHGRTIQAELLHRAGYEAFSWGDNGLQRIAQRLRTLADAFDPDWYEADIAAYRIIVTRTGADLPLQTPSVGRSVAGVDWTHRPAGPA